MEEEMTMEPVQAQIDRADGEYSIEVELSGGSGRATIESPTRIYIEDQKATALISWSSSNYDYMRIGDQIYDPVSEEGNSVFEIPVLAWDQEMEVVADTTAMSTPHEIAYTLKFDTSTIKSADNQTGMWAGIGVTVVLAVGIAAAFCRRKRTL